MQYMYNNRVVLFKCKWFDIDRKRKRVRQDYHLTSINVTRTWYIEDPFVLASQARQVMYIDDLKLGKGWKVVEKVQHRGVWDIQEKDEVVEDTQE